MVYSQTALKEVRGALQHLLSLPPNWDSYGAPQISPVAVARVTDLLDTLMREATPAPSVVPTSQGGVQLEWHVSDIDLEIDVPPEGPLGVAFESMTTGDAWERQVALDDLTPIVEAIGRLSAGV